MTARSGNTKRVSSRRGAAEIRLSDLYDAKFLAKFRDSVQLAPSGCLEWTGTRDKHGYGRVRVGDQNLGAYRAAWMIAHRKLVPPGLVIDHMCCNKPCVSAYHLEAVTPAENTRRIWKPAPGWEIVPEAAVVELPEASGHPQRWWVEWRTLDAKGREGKQSRIFHDLAEAEAFAQHKRSIPVRAGRKPSDDIPPWMLEILNEIYYPSATESWLRTKHRSLNG